MNYQDYIPHLIAGVASILAIASLIIALSLQRLRKIFFSGKEANQLEDFIIHQNKRLNELTERADYIEKAIYSLQEAQKLSVQKIGLVRYNSFADSGGNLSFSMALLDMKGNGIVITSMHGREHNRIYSKPVIHGRSEHSLTDEEQQAINEAALFHEQQIEEVHNI